MKDIESELKTVTSQVAGANKDDGEMVVRPYGKFKDAESLLKAYESLESEFTRRSQRLKAIEGELALRSEKDKAKGNAVGLATAEEFVGRYPHAVKYAEEIKRKQSEDGEGFQGVEDAYIKILERELVGAQSKLSENKGDFHQDLSDAVIKDYLKKVMNAKSTVKHTGGTMLTVPPRKPSTLQEASAIAKNYIKRKGE